MKGKMKTRIAAFVCAAALTVSSVVTTPAVTVQAKTLSGLKELGRQVADEGCVLIENKNNVLPFEDGTTVSVFGRSQCHYDRFKSGLGSGGEVRVDGKNVIDYIEAIRDHSDLDVNEDLVKIYQDWVKNNPYDDGDGNWVNWPWSQKEMPMTQDIANTAKSKSDAAVIIISRTAGENRDSSFQKGGYLLTDEEENMIKIVSETFDKTVVLLNVTAIIDMSWVDEYKVDSVVYTWNGGENGGQAVADVLSGDVNPSGRLSDTIATDYTKYPTYENYGGAEKTYYKEDIYVGYRYFETFAPQDVEYPFGYGLSYTTFDISTNSVVEDGDNLKVTVSVTNTGNVAGKEVVQVYYGAPQAQLGNPVKELAAFAKTEILQPGDTQNLALSFKISEMASYDDSGVTGHESAYVLEAGDYQVYVGNNVRESELAYTYNIPELKVVQQLTEAAAPYKNENFNRIKAVEGSDGEIKQETEKVPTLKTNVEEKIKNNLPDELKVKDDKKYTLKDVYDGKLTMEQFVAQMTNEELAAIVQGSENDGAHGVTSGNAGALGGVECKTDGKLTNLGAVYGIPLVAVADGPSGIRISDYCTLLPCGNVIGCTWNPELVEDMFELEGQELVLNGVDNLLGPGINIRRDPRCGRNFEYYSEDPLVTGMMAAATAQGVQKSGATVTAKHFACNNQECDINLNESRRNTDSIVSERALREIYLKGFEMYVKAGCARSLMTAYNPVNGCWAASNYDLNTQILREEWGYEGIVMTDWWGHMSKYPWADGNRDRKDSYLATMVKAQNDVFMPVDNIYDKNGNSNGKMNNILENLESGYLTRAELQRSAVNICNFVMRSQCFFTYNKMDFKPYFVEGEDWFKVEQAELGNPQVTGLSVDGRAIATFNQKVLEYKVYLPKDATTIPVVSATAEEGTTVTIEQATSENRTAIVRAKEQLATKVYRIIFTDAENMTPVFEDAVMAKLSGISVNGKAVSGFDAEIYEYGVAVDSLSEAPQIVCETPEGVTATPQYDADSKTATIKVVSKDQAGSYKLRFGIAPQSDEFEGTQLNAFWTVEQPNAANGKLVDGHLVIGAERGSVWGNQTDLKNQFIQSAYGDWESVTKIDLPKLPNQSYQSLGVVAMEDQDNYIYVKIEYGNDGLIIALNQETGGSNKNVELLSDADVAQFKDTMYVQLTKLGNTYQAAVSPDGKNYISFKSSAYGEYVNPKFMLINGNGDKNLNETLEAKFDYVHFETEKIGDVITIGADTKIKVAEVKPIAISSGLKPAECQDTDGGYYLTDTEEGEYVIYNVNVAQTGIYDLTARLSSPESDTQQVTFTVLSDNVILTDFFANGTGGEQVWTDISGSTAKLTAGNHNLKIAFDTSSINLNWIKLTLKQELKDEALKTAVDAANAKDLSVYTEESKAAYVAAVKVAEETLEKATTQEEYDKALADLQEAEKKLNVEGGITGVTASPESLSIKIGETAKINVAVEPADFKETLQWKSENPEIASVTGDGTVTGMSAGTTNIIVGNGRGVEAKIAVTVTDEGQQGTTENPGTTQENPGTTQDPNTTEENPGTTENTATTENPGDDKNPGTTEDSATTEDSGDDKNPGTTEDTATTEDSEDDKNPGTTEDTATTEDSGDDKNPGTTENPATTEDSGDDKDPGTTENPATTEDSGDDKDPGTTENPATTEDSGDDRNPATTEQNGDKQPSSTEQPPATTEQPGTTEQSGNGNKITPDNFSSADLETIEVELGVSSERAKKIGEVAKQNNVSLDTVLITDDVVKDLSDDEEVAGSSFVLLQAKASKQTKTSVKLKWNKVKNADGYLIYGNKCGKKNSYKLITDIKNGKKTSYTQKKLKKGTYYKYLVCAYKKVDGTKVTLAASKTIHTVTKGGAYGVAKKVNLNTKSKTLKVNGTYRIKATEVKADKKIKKHRKVCYESDNPAVATVSKKGVIKAKKEGTCYVYVYAQNGVCKKVKVTVK